MSYEIRPVRYSEILGAEGAAELLAEYSAECSIPEIGETDPQAGLYAQMENAGMMSCFGVFWCESLVGFATILVYVLPHYGRRVASVESLFVAQGHRAGGGGKDLMRAIEQEAKSAGSVAMLYSAPTGSQLERLLSLQKGYRRTNAVFTRKLQ